MKSVKRVYTFAIVIFWVLTMAFSASAKTGLTMRCRFVVPKEYRKTPFSPPLNGEPEPVRYKVAYEAFWWNCVAIRAANLNARCPFMASGTPAASAGGTDGAMNADSQIEGLLKKHAANEVQKYLQSIAGTSKARDKMRPYFDKPRADATD